MSLLKKIFNVEEEDTEEEESYRTAVENWAETHSQSALSEKLSNTSLSKI